MKGHFCVTKCVAGFTSIAPEQGIIQENRTLNVIAGIVVTSKEPVCPRVELILKIIIILLIIFLGFIKSKPC